MDVPFDHRLWGAVAPDGPAYCHWGGRRQSRVLAELLYLRPRDRVLELCCGRGGFLKVIIRTGQCRFVCGLDLSAEALRFAKQGGIQVVRGDALRLPFRDGSFTKLVAQDADAWLTRQKGVLMREVSRVIKKGGQFVFQSYVQSRRMPARHRERTMSLLRQCGYDQTSLLIQEGLRRMFVSAGFRVVRCVSLHDLYCRDNERMIAKFNENRRRLLKTYSGTIVRSLGRLLCWEQRLLAEHFWSGVLVIARKEECHATKRVQQECRGRCTGIHTRLL